MKHAILLFLFCFGLCFLAYSQGTPDRNNSTEYAYTPLRLKQQTKKNVRLYPNPAILYFEVQGTEEVRKIIVSNIFGQKIKTFSAQKDKRYDIEDLPMGVYLVQLFDEQNKIISTKRLSKRLP